MAKRGKSSKPEMLSDSNSLPFTDLLMAARHGNRSAQAEVMKLAYAELHDEAKRIFRRERLGHTLQPTAVVNEAWLRLIRPDGKLNIPKANRDFFLIIAANAMHRALIDHARRRDRLRRGGGKAKVNIDDHDVADPQLLAPESIDVVEALKALRSRNELWEAVFKMKCYERYENQEIALKLGISIERVKNYWREAKIWLEHKLSSYVQEAE